MKNTSTFQLILLVIAGFAIVIGVLIFAFASGRGGSTTQLMTVWGTLPQEVFDEAVKNLQVEEGENIVRIAYTEIAEDVFDQEFVEKLAEGSGPDIVILPQEMIVPHQNKLLTVSYEFYPQRNFLNTFIEHGELFTHQDGVIGLPLTVDPLVMYWNRTHFSNKGVVQPPQYWDELLTLVPELTEVDSTFTIFRSGVALGEIANINNGKEIFLTLTKQAGNPIVVRDESKSGIYDDYDVVLSSRLGYSRIPAEAALDFFAQFSNPSKTVYSWNRSLPDSQDRFVSGDLSIYFGLASEVEVIRRRNPNLNFDVALVPQSRNGGAESYGHMNALAITKSTSNPGEAFRVVSKLTEPLTTQYIADALGTPPPRRDLLGEQPSDAFKTVLYRAASRSFGGFDLDPSQTDVILQDMIESYTSGRLRVSEAVIRAQDELEALNN